MRDYRTKRKHNNTHTHDNAVAVNALQMLIMAYSKPKTTKVKFYIDPDTKTLVMSFDKELEVYGIDNIGHASKKDLINELNRISEFIYNRITTIEALIEDND